MKALFQRLFAGRETTRSAPAPSSHPAVASALESGEDVQRDYDEFCRTFHFKPNQLLMDYLASEAVHGLRDWFHPSTPEPEPKAFIRLANGATREGVQVWKQTGVQMYLHGRWSQGGGPSQRSRECLSVLAQVLEMPIAVYFQTSENADPSDMKVITFEP